LVKNVCFLKRVSSGRIVITYCIQGSLDRYRPKATVENKYKRGLGRPTFLKKKNVYTSAAKLQGGPRSKHKYNKVLRPDKIRKNVDAFNGDELVSRGSRGFKGACTQMEDRAM
jgi:hypothetical protein